MLLITNKLIRDKNTDTQKYSQILKGNVLIGYLLYINYCITLFHKLGENGLVDCFEILSHILHILLSSTSHINLVTFCHLKTKIGTKSDTL